MALLNSPASRAALAEFPGDPLQATPRGQARALSVRVGKTIELTSSFCRCWFPTVHRFSNGDLMATMRMSPDEINPEGDFSAYCISKDHGLTWSRRYTMGAGANVDGAWSQNPLPDGSIWQLYGWTDTKLPGDAKNLYLTFTQFSQSGMEIHQRRNIPLYMSEPVQMLQAELSARRVQDGGLSRVPSAMPWGPIIASRHGGLIAPIYFKVERDPRYYRVALLRSDDNGKTWHEGATIAAAEHGIKLWPGMGHEGPGETGMARLTDGRLFAMFRTGSDGFMGAAWSSNDGHTWTSPVPLPYRGVSPHVRRLSNGVLACSTGRPGPVAMMFSIDGTGETWSQTTSIFTDHSTCYTDFVEFEPGKLFVVYDSTPYDWGIIPLTDRNSRNAIYGTFVDFELR
jgi:hypothetical protein